MQKEGSGALYRRDIYENPSIVLSVSAINEYQLLKWGRHTKVAVL
jgi:hypothetical protein